MLTLEEVKRFAFQMHLDKAPGVDGFYTALFFSLKNFWQLIEDEVFRSCASWSNRKQFPSKLSDINVTLTTTAKCVGNECIGDLFFH